ncbi:hypothetical protein BDU57DRAFT_527322 [Ampelomyces quisqualis]|uniref:CFEM domain-containing protein n=1 Tax=Ampelomyces quisqualis TaxID=50730 RepID=A0A6A5QUA8_AMPQU|nr:hypothetical protein BDU57DRAFT_527322 [Ampelomyces quisqualis]
MMLNTILAVITTIAPATLALPSILSANSFKIPTCGAEACLAKTNGTFDACTPNDLACLCRLDQSRLDTYVATVQPCIDGAVGHNTCTDGAIYQYKDVLTTVCADDAFGHKKVSFAPKN